MGKHRTFTSEFKAEVVLKVISGEHPAAELCRQHQLKPQQLSEWKAEFVANAAHVFQRDTQADTSQLRIAELEQLVGRLTLELEAAKKVSRFLTFPSNKNGRRS
jgi:transposase-like protein